MDTWARPSVRPVHGPDLTRFDSLVRTLPELDDECRAVYRAAVRHGRVALEDLRVPGDRALRCAQMLVEVGLLRADAGSPSQYVAVDPETAFTEILAPAEHRLREAKLHLEETRARLVARLSDYRGLAVPPYAAPATSALRTEASMDRFYANEVERCTSEFVVVRADQPPGGASLPHDLREERLVKRGVVVRSLLSHTAAARFDTRAILRRIRADGAQVRTCDETWGELAIFDRSVMILIPRRQSETGTAALVSREPVLLEYLLGMFESAWNRALVYDIEDQLTYQENKISDIGLAILVHMASGCKDEVIARRLGMSVRTCRGHIARMLRELGADSRFQAGIIAAQRGLLARSTSGDLGGL